MQKTGTLKVVASTGGLKFIGKDAEWMNPAKEITAEGMEHLKALKNKRVIIDFNDKGRYIRCELDTANNREIPNYPANEQKSAPEPAKTEGIQKMNISMTLGKNFNHIKLELLDIEITPNNDNLSTPIQEKLDFLREEIKKAHDNIGDEFNDKR